MARAKSKTSKKLSDVKVEKCQKCDQEYTDNHEMIICERCSGFYCWSCCEITNRQYALISSMPNFHWFCDGCDKSATTAVKNDNQIEEFKKCFMAEISDLKKEVEDLKSKKLEQDLRLEKLEASLEESKSRSNLRPEDTKVTESKTGKPTTDALVRNSVTEVEEREKRKNNIVWYGIPESKSEDTEKRIKDDQSYVENVIKTVFKIDPSTKILKARRFGRRDSTKENQRPLLTTFSSEDTVSFILKNGRLLGNEENTEFKQVAVKKDMTFLERADHKKLMTIRAQKKEETKKNGTKEIWVIRNGKVVDISRKIALAKDME